MNIEPKILGLVLGVEVLEVYPPFQNLVEYKIKLDYVHNEHESIKTENIDTLARKMKEWCWDKYCIYPTVALLPPYYWITNKDISISIYEDTEFEAVYRAVEYVAKEKGLV